MYCKIRKTARQNLKGNCATAIVAMLLEGAILAAATRYTAGIISLLLTGAMTLGLASFFVSLSRDHTGKLEKLFDGFRGNNLVRTLVINVLQGVYVMLWMLLFIIPGIVMSFAYSMAYHVAIDHPEMSASECLAESRRLMRGHKMHLFCLMLSFFWWYVLSVLTFGILLLWVLPWVEEAKAVFYEEITGKRPELVND